MHPTRSKARSIFRIVFLIIGAACLVAFFVDYRRFHGAFGGERLPTVEEELKTVILGLGEKTYTDRSGRFTVAVPPGWNQLSADGSMPYDIAFVSPNRASIRIMATSVPYDTLRELYETIEAREKSRDIRTELTTIKKWGLDVIQRRADLTSESVVSFDVVQDFVAYHIMCAMPKDFAKQYEPVIVDVVDTFKIVAQPKASAE